MNTCCFWNHEREHHAAREGCGGVTRTTPQVCTRRSTMDVTWTHILCKHECDHHVAREACEGHNMNTCCAATTNATTTPARKRVRRVTSTRVALQPQARPQPLHATGYKGVT